MLIAEKLDLCRRGTIIACIIALISAVHTTAEPPLLTEHQKLLASDGAPSDLFGSAIEREGDTMIVGAPQHPTNKLPGSFYVFERDGTGQWVEQTRVFGDYQPGEGDFGDHFGASLALQGDTLLVGAPFAELNGAIRVGRVYVFESEDGAWVKRQILLPDTGENSRFGTGVALVGDTAVVTGLSMVFVFTRDASGQWSQQDEFPAWETGSIRTMAFDGQRIAITRYDPNNSNLPQAVIFTAGDDESEGWGEPQPITSSVGEESGFVTAIGVRFFAEQLALGVLDLSGPDFVFLFAPDAKTGWSEELVITNPVTDDPYPDNDSFGAMIHGAGDAMIVGANHANRAHVFLRGNDGGWTNTVQLRPSDEYVLAKNFGKTVHLLDGLPVVASPAHHENGLYAGAAYIFDAVPTPRPADLNGDGVVDGADLLILLSGWGECADPGDCTADINDDGNVDGADLLILLSDWG